jgi:F0F1-type ATP synthase assembly protein I
MNSSLKKFTIGLIGIAVFILVIGYIVFYLIDDQYYFSFFPWLVLGFAGVTLVIHLFVSKGLKKNMNRFTSRFMGAMGIKILIYLAFLVIYLSIEKNIHLFSFIITFVFCYIAYTAYEIKTLYSMLKNSKSK